MPGDHEAKLMALNAELDKLDYELWKLYLRRSSGWQLRLGRLQIRREMNSRAWFIAFVGLCLASFFAGAVLAVLDSTRELGVAMVVGSIFACASFLGQVWTLQVQNERTTWDRFFGADERRSVWELMRRREQLADEIEQLSSTPSGHASAARPGPTASV